MKKLAIIVITFVIFFLINATGIYATGKGGGCDITSNDLRKGCDEGLACQITDPDTSKTAGTCQTSIDIEKPQKGFATLGNAVSNILTVAFIVAALIVLVMLIWGAFEWIVSGGDKEAVGKARGRIINALIGLAVLAIAFALARVAGQFTNVDIFNLVIPTPNPDAKGV